MTNLIEDGWHVLTGIGETTVKDDWYNRDADAVVFQLDGKNYIVYADEDDGLRSYGRIYETNEKPQMTFIGQQVHAFTEVVDTYDDSGYWPIKRTVLHLENANGETVLEIGTDESDAYYPLAIFHWYPENLPINKGRVENF